MARVLKSDSYLWEKAVEFVKKKESQWDDYWSDYHTWCRGIYRLYLARQKKGLSNKARLILSTPFSIIETVAAETYRALFDESPYWKQKPRGPEDEELAEAVTQYTAYQTDKNKMRIQGYIFEKNRLMFGLGFAFVPWTLAKEWKRRESPLMGPQFIDDGFGNLIPQIDESGNQIMGPMMGPFGPMTEKKFIKEITKDCWDFEPLLPWHVLPDPSIRNPLGLMDQGEGVIIHRWFSKNELKKKQRDGTYKNIQDYFDAKKDKSESSRSFSLPEDDETADDLHDGYNYQNHLEHVKQFWGKCPVVSVEKKSGEKLEWDEDAEPVECLIDVSDSTCFRIIRNPIDEQIRPILAAQCHPIADSLKSPGIFNAVESELQELEEFRNARMENLKRKMFPMWQVSSQTTLATRDLKYVPNKVIKTPFPGQDIAEVPSGDLGQTLESDLGQLEYNIQNATNALSASQSASNMGQAFGNTAKGIDFFQTRMQRRLQVIVDVAEDQFFGVLSDIVNAYNQQFLTKPEDFGVIGKENVYMKISPDAYLQRRDISPVGASRKLNRGQMIQILDRMMTELSSFKDFAKVDVLLKEFVKLTDLFPNPEKILYTEEDRASMPKDPNIKKGFNLSANLADVDPTLREILLKEVFPDIQKNLPEMSQGLTPQENNILNLPYAAG